MSYPQGLTKSEAAEYYYEILLEFQGICIEQNLSFALILANLLTTIMKLSPDELDKLQTHELILEVIDFKEAEIVNELIVKAQEARKSVARRNEVLRSERAGQANNDFDRFIVDVIRKNPGITSSEIKNRLRNEGFRQTNLIPKLTYMTHSGVVRREVTNKESPVGRLNPYRYFVDTDDEKEPSNGEESCCSVKRPL